MEKIKYENGMTGTTCKHRKSRNLCCPCMTARSASTCRCTGIRVEMSGKRQLMCSRRPSERGLNLYLCSPKELVPSTSICSIKCYDVHKPPPRPSKCTQKRNANHTIPSTQETCSETIEAILDRGTPNPFLACFTSTISVCLTELAGSWEKRRRFTGPRTARIATP
jgi:hypothetical protein